MEKRNKNYTWVLSLVQTHKKSFGKEDWVRKESDSSLVWKS